MTALLGLAMGCSEAPAATQTVVEVDADPGVESATTHVVIEVLGRAPGETAFTSVSTTTLGDDESLIFPIRVVVAPRDGDETRRFRVVVTAFDGDTMRVRTSAASGYLEGRTLLLRMQLETACFSVSCDPGSACFSGTCLDEYRDPATLPNLGSDAGTDAGGPVDAGADAGSPDAGTDAGSDAGADAGSPDAGADAGSPDAGSDAGVVGPPVCATPVGVTLRDDADWLVVPVGMSYELDGNRSYAMGVHVAGTLVVRKIGMGGTGILSITTPSFSIAASGVVDGTGAGALGHTRCGPDGALGDGPGGADSTLYYGNTNCGTTQSFAWGAGAGHGAPGLPPLVNSMFVGIGPAYGTADGLSPEIGSAGGAGNCAAGGDGGGALHVDATSICVSGQIRMNGIAGDNNCSPGGGGSGGSITLLATSTDLAATSRIETRGGPRTMAFFHPANQSLSGAGAGGRIRLFHGGYLGTGGIIEVNSGDPGAGGAGTVVQCLDTNRDGTCD